MIGRHANAKHCSRKCSLLKNGNGGKAGSAMQCAYCGVAFVHDGTAKRHCSVECRQAFQAERKRARKGHIPAAFSGPFPAKECAVCGKKFEGRDSRQIYCEPRGKCSQIAFRATEAWANYASRENVRARRREAGRKHSATEHGLEMGAKRKRREKRTRAAARHMQEALAAIPKIMALMAKMENRHDQ